MRLGRWIALIGFLAAPALASTYFTVEKICPVGGQKFKYQSLGSISTWGAFPDGMPIGSGMFPVQLPQCPGNGLVMFRDFDKAAVAKLTPYVGGTEYRELRAAGETPYYLAYQTSRMLADPEPEWLLLSASWEAKNAGEAESARAARYNAEFVDLVKQRAISATEFESIALRARAANALRELGRFDEAEALRASIVIAPDAGGAGDDAAQNREGWSSYVAKLAAPIVRKDMTRAPLDMIGDNEAVFRCLGKEFAAKYAEPAPPPLTEFETQYCARPELAETIAERRTQLASE